MKTSDIWLLFAGFCFAGGLTVLALYEVHRQFAACDVYILTDRYAFCVEAGHVVDLADTKTDLERVP